MNQKTAMAMWDHIRQINGVTLRLIDALPAEQLDAHPIPNMRTPKELVVHMYDIVIKALAEGLASGAIIADESAEKSLAAGLRSKQELLDFATRCWKDADRAIATVTDAHLAANVKTPWSAEGMDGARVIPVISDELIHHRGQLYVYARAFGLEPPFLWDFAHNAPEYQPRTAAKV